MEATGGTKKNLKSTFGVAERFSAAKQTCSPSQDRYYAHSKIWNSEDYLSQYRSCSFGACGKTDFSNPLNGPRYEASPVSYRPIASSAKATSPLDGLTSRKASPVSAYCKVLQSTKKGNASARESSPMRGKLHKAGSSEVQAKAQES